MWNVVFDVGGVLIDWNPEHLYGRTIASPERRRWFLDHVCNGAWNAKQDLGRSWREAEEEAIGAFPEWRQEILDYRRRWGEMVSGPVPGGFELLGEIHARKHRLTGLSNWNGETFADMRALFPLLGLFEGVTVSGEVGLAKPDPAIYRHHQDRFGLDTARTVFIDDNRLNIEAARAMGWRTVHFADAASARAALVEIGILC